MSRGGVNAVKIVMIDTQYIETDARSFKSVVQRLTGKDSNIEEAMEPAGVQSQKKMYLMGSPLASISNNTSTNNAKFFSRGMSFKDIDWLLDIELPPLNEELYRLLAN